MYGQKTVRKGHGGGELPDQLSDHHAAHALLPEQPEVIAKQVIKYLENYIW